MKLYCRACGHNHDFDMEMTERLVYALECALCDAFAEGVGASEPAEDAITICLQGMVGASYGEGAYSEYADVAVMLRHSDARGTVGMLFCEAA